MNDQATELRTLAAQQGIKPPAPDVDKARLWDEQRENLQTVLDRASHEPWTCNPLDEAWTNDEDMEAVDEAIAEAFFEGVKFALDRMLQAETFARYVKPATPATFDRVREDMGGRG